MNNFCVHGVDYSFDPIEHSQIEDYGWFMKEFSSGKWENDTFDTFKMVKDPTKTAIDIGAWIGPTVIWLSKHFKNVIAIEADTVAISSLKSNLKTTDCTNVKIIERPIYSESDVKMIFGSNSNRPSNLGNSMSQLKTAASSMQDYEVSTITLSDILEDVKDVSFIKVDIEGGEEYIIPELFETCSKNGYSLWISFHYSWWKDLNIDRFDKYFALVKNESDISGKVKSQPFTSMFLTF
jgi:FkbM family methyltransferase